MVIAFKNRVQILDKTICLSFYIKALEKGMNPVLFIT